jgi:hypothetical protein
MASDNSSQELRDNYPYQFGDETEQRKKQRQTSHRYDRLVSGRGEEHRHASQQRKYSSVIGKSCGLSPAVVTLAVDSLLDVYLVPRGLWKLFEMRPPAQQFRRCDIPAPRPRGTLNCSNQAKPRCSQQYQGRIRPPDPLRASKDETDQREAETSEQWSSHSPRTLQCSGRAVGLGHTPRRPIPRTGRSWRWSGHELSPCQPLPCSQSLPLHPMFTQTVTADRSRSKFLRSDRPSWLNRG